MLYTEGFTSLSRVTFATDDGSKGIKGPITLALEASLDESCENVTVYATGPKPMLARVANLTALYDIRCELSLEAFMACGIGACNGCVVKATGKDGEPSYLRVCKDGPVFNSKRIVSF